MNDLIPDLLGRCALGDQSAFARLYEHCAPKLYGVAFRLLRQRALTDDAMQEIFMKIWYRASSYRADLANPMTWMTSITRHHALDVLARAGREDRTIDRNVDYAEIDIEDESANPEYAAWMKDATKELEDCLGTLRDQHKQCIRLIYWNGMTYQELAEKTKTPLGTVKVWVRRGLDKLKGCLEK